MRWLGGLPRGTKKFLLVGLDTVSLILLLWISFSIRLGHFFVPNSGQTLLILAAPVIAVPIFAWMGLYRSVVRYLPGKAIWPIVVAVTVAVFAWVSLAFLTQMTGVRGLPRSIPIYFWCFSLIAIAGSRYGAQWLLARGATPRAYVLRTLIFGTGNAAVQLATALTRAHEREVTGFVTDDSSLQGMKMMGLRIYPLSGLEKVIANFGIDEVISVLPLPDGVSQRDLVMRFSSLPARLRILPPITDLAAGRYSISNVRDIDIDDLLRRSPVPADPDLMRGVIEGRVILVTGAAGSIGSELCRTVADLKPAKLLLLDFNEHGMFQIARELARNAGFPVVRLLGSVTDASLVRQVLAEHRVDTVYHCAAFKHVSLVEENCLEGARNNVLGTWTMAEAAYDCGVRNFILISSDKAVNPASVMGATKRWSERIVLYQSMRKRAVEGRFACVRFGNVVGSSGSVVPLFREQIAAGGPVTVTHEDMTRYFMSVREATELIVQATALSATGDILLLDMGDPVRIKDLAEDMIVLAGRSLRSPANPAGDIEIVIVGAAEGEKLHEELTHDPAGIAPTSHPKILRTSRMEMLPVDLPHWVGDLAGCIEARDEAAVRQKLFDAT